MRRAAALLLLLGLLAPSARASRSAHVREVYGACLSTVNVRQGVQHRSLVLVALVRQSPVPSGGVLVDPTRATWAEADGKEATTHAALTVRSDGEAPPRLLLPAATVLRAGAHERLLLRPALLMPGATFVARTATLAAAPVIPAPAEGVVGGLAPPEFGHTLFLLREREALAELLALEAAALGEDPNATAPSLAGLASDAAVGPKVAACTRALRALGTAYGGETVGHVAFLGEGVVQLLLARTPESYRSLVEHAAPGLGLAVTAWEALYGLADGPIPTARWGETLDATTRMIEHLRAASFKSERRKDETGDGGELWRVRATRATRSGRPPDVGWILLDEEGRLALLQAWPDNAPLPPPAGPDGPGEPDDTDDDSGAMTWYFAKRFYDRFPWRRTPEWVRRHPRPPIGDGR